MRIILASACSLLIGFSTACQVFTTATPVRSNPTDRLPVHEDDKTPIPAAPLEIGQITVDEVVTPTDSPPTPIQAFELCSPLSLHPLDELPAIISDPYNPPPPGREERHHGVDFGYYHYQERDSMLGEPVQAVLPGNAAAVIDDLYPYGNMVIIETAYARIPVTAREVIHINENESLYILYAHLDQAPLVGLRDQVNACQLLGEVGKSGNADIPHLHLETRLGPPGTVFVSMRFYDTRASVEEMENYKLWRTSGVYRHFDPMKILSP